MSHYNKRAARLRQAIIRRVDDHMRDWWQGHDLRADKFQREIDELIDEYTQETLRNSSHDE